MRPMNSSLNGFRAALVIGWAALSAAGLAFAQLRSIPLTAALPVIAAFLIEYPFYLAIGFGATRERIAGPNLPWFLVGAAALPYLACCCGAIPFEWTGLAKICAMALAVGLWYRVLPPRPLFDFGFLALLLVLTVGKLFASVYPDFLGLKILILGHTALLVCAVAALILERGLPSFGLGFWPKPHEWGIGVSNFLYFVVVGAPLAYLLSAVRVSPAAAFWTGAGRFEGAFFGGLWYVAFGEEFFFRGVLQRYLEDWTASRLAALVTGSILFGLVHIGPRQFPNWRWVVVTAVLGWFCARARMQAGGVRAAMVTHALAIGVYTGFLR